MRMLKSKMKNDRIFESQPNQMGNLVLLPLSKTGKGLATSRCDLVYLDLFFFLFPLSIPLECMPKHISEIAVV